MKIKFFKKEKNFKKTSSRLSPNFFWRLSIFVLFIVAIFSAFFGYYLFGRINEEPVLMAGESQIGTVKKEKIDKTLEYFSEREQKSSQIINSPASSVDPSL